MHAEVLLRPGMDMMVDPRVDFYNYANGTWMKTAVIPSDKPAWGSFVELGDTNWQKIKGILEETSTLKSPTPGSIEQKVGDFYASAMDTAQIEKQGIKPLDSYFQQINAIASRTDLVNEIVSLQKCHMDPLFDGSVAVDEKDSDHMAFYLSQGGLGLPSREYYFSDLFVKVRQAYQEHIKAMFILLGDSPDIASRNAQTVFEIETELAKDSRKMVDLRDAIKNYNPMNLDIMMKLAPNFLWKEYFDSIGLGSDPHGVVGQPEFFTAVDHLLQERSLDDWKSYLRWNLINNTAKYLGSAFEDEHFHFYLTVLNGTKQKEPRWQRVARQTDSSLGEALGQLYVSKYFPPEVKKRASEMISSILEVFHGRLEHVEWMTPETRQKALQKFVALRVKVGYPDKWIDYSKLQIDRDSYVTNVLRAHAFEFHRQMDKLNKPVDKTEWHMTPSTVNAYNNPTGNEVVFPAGILQPPFFDPSADDAVNYGGIGAVIAHEITHGYDDQGRKYDAKGNLKEWWTLKDAAQFKERSQKLVAQFSNYEALPDLKVNGELCLGEDIADLGGVSIAYEALHHIKGRENEPSLIEDLTRDQRFFLAWAKIWRSKYREEYLKNMITVNVHAPGQFRAIGAPSNLSEFFTAFGIKPGDPMWFPVESRAKIW